MPSGGDEVDARVTAEGGLASRPALVAEITRPEQLVGGREHGAVALIEAIGGSPVAQRDQFPAIATEWRL